MTAQTDQPPRPETKAKSPNQGAPQAPVDDQQAQIKTILDRARAGDRSVLPELERLLAANPKYWNNAGDLIRATEQLWLDKIGGKDLVFSQSLRKHVERWKQELADPAASPLERLLAARIVVSWLAAQHAEMAEAVMPQDGSKVTELRMRRAESANRRLLAAIKTLATVRRLVGGLKIEIQHTGTPSDAVAGTRDPVPPPDSRGQRATGSATSDAVGVDTAVRDRLDQLFKDNLTPDETVAAGV